MNADYYLKVIIPMLEALPTTLSITFFSFILGLLLAVILALIDHFKTPILSQIATVFVSFFRNTPQIPQLFLLYFGLPTLFPILKTASPYFICIIALSFNAAAYMKEVIRGSILSVPQGQIEAALAHGVPHLKIMQSIVLPQAIRVALPSLFNNLVDVLKGSSIAFTIGVVEITAVAKLRAAVSFNYFETFMLLILVYWGLIILLERISIRLVRYLGKKYQK